MQSRRRLLQGALTTGILGLGCSVGYSKRWGPPRPTPRDPFGVGIASGGLRADGVSLWTRLAPMPTEPDGGLDPVPVDVRWELADDASFGNVRADGEVRARPDDAFAVHVDVSGLPAGRRYFYRFHAFGATSALGHTRTLAAPGSPVGRLRFGYGSCQHLEQGWFVAQRHLADEDLDLMLFLGDSIYEESWGVDLVRRFARGPCLLLEDYRIRWAETLADPDLQRLRARVPSRILWDDHELWNDWAGGDRTLSRMRRDFAVRAFLEHNPVSGGADPWPALSGGWSEGELVRFFALDDRSFRSKQACAAEGDSEVRPEDCPELLDPARTLLGDPQHRALADHLAGAPERFTVIAQQSLVCPNPDPAGRRWTDGWDGYPHDRRRLLDVLARAPDPLVIGGDVHRAVAANLHADPEDPATPIVAAEVCGTSLTSQGGTAADDARAMHEPVLFSDGVHRGYTVVELRPAGGTVTTRIVDEKDPNSGVRTSATFALEPGRRGLQRS